MENEFGATSSRIVMVSGDPNLEERKRVRGERMAALHRRDGSGQSSVKMTMGALELALLVSFDHLLLLLLLVIPDNSSMHRVSDRNCSMRQIFENENIVKV